METKTIILGVTGSIAAHRAVDLTSLLTKKGYAVNVVLTADAQKFITPLACKTLSHRPVITNLYDDTDHWKPAHILLADTADLFLIAPASANTIAKIALGLADNALTCIALALQPNAKILIAPAMNGKMWLNPITQQHVTTLKSRLVQFVGPAEGQLACGYEGVGRMADITEIANQALKLLESNA